MTADERSRVVVIDERMGDPPPPKPPRGAVPTANEMLSRLRESSRLVILPIVRDWLRDSYAGQPVWLPKEREAAIIVWRWMRWPDDDDGPLGSVVIRRVTGSIRQREAWRATACGRGYDGSLILQPMTTAGRLVHELIRDEEERVRLEIAQDAFVAEFGSAARINPTEETHA